MRERGNSADIEDKIHRQVTILEKTTLSSQPIPSVSTHTTPSVGWCPTSFYSDPGKFFVATRSKIRVFDMAPWLFGGDMNTCLPQYQFNAPKSISALAVSNRPRGLAPDFALTYQDTGGVEIVGMGDSGEEALMVKERLFNSPPSTMVCTCLVWNADADMLLFGDDSGYIHLCHLTTGQDISQQKMKLDPIRDIRLLSPSCFIACDGTASVFLWDLRDKSTARVTLKVLPARFHPYDARPVMGINVSGCLVVCADMEGRALMWDVRFTDKPLSTHHGELDTLSHPSKLSTSPTGVYLVGNFLCVGGRHSTLSLYHRESTYPVCYHSLGKGSFGGASVGRLEYSADVKRVLAADSCGSVSVMTIHTEVTEELALSTHLAGSSRDAFAFSLHPK